MRTSNSSSSGAPTGPRPHLRLLLPLRVHHHERRAQLGHRVPGPRPDGRTSIAVGNLELRFPVVNSYLGIGPRGLPYIDGVGWIDYGVAWNDFNTVAFRVNSSDTPAQQLLTRTPVTSFGFGLRMNLFGYMILRADYAFPQGRGIPPYWTISIGPPF